MLGISTSQQTLAPLGAAAAPTVWYFRVRDGVDPVREADALEAAFLDSGMQATAQSETLHDAVSASLTFQYLILGFLALGLVIGVAALGVISARSVVERRQQIGVLRAIGFQARMVQMSFLVESLIVTLVGVVVGSVLGLWVAFNVIQDTAEPARLREPHPRPALVGPGDHPRGGRPLLGARHLAAERARLADLPGDGTALRMTGRSLRAPGPGPDHPLRMTRGRCGRRNGRKGSLPTSPRGRARVRLPPDRRPRNDRRPPDLRAGDHRRLDRLVLRATLRLPQHVRRPARPSEGRALPGAPEHRGLHHQAALLPGHRRPGDPVPHRGRGRRGRRLHADRRPHDRHRPAPDHPHGPVRPRQDGLRRRPRPPLRLRPRAPRDAAHRGRGGLREQPRLADRQPGQGARGRAARPRPGGRRGRSARPGRARRRTDARSGPGDGCSGPGAAGAACRGPAALRRDRALLGVLAGAVDVRGPLAGDAEPLGDHAQADDLRPDRRPCRGAHRGPARAGRRRAELGLPLHLGARRVLLRLRADGSRLHRGGERHWGTGSAPGSRSSPGATARGRCRSCTGSTGPAT